MVSVQPISRICPPSNEQSTFCPMPVVRAWVSAASAPPNARMAQVSSATDTMPVRSGWPGVEYASAMPPSACAIESVPGSAAFGPFGP